MKIFAQLLGLLEQAQEKYHEMSPHGHINYSRQETKSNRSSLQTSALQNQSQFQRRAKRTNVP